MKRNGIDRALVAALLLFSMAASCGRRDPGPGGAHVILALPREAVQEVSSVDVIVDQPLVEIGATSAPVPRAPFEIRPRVSGRYRWIGSRTASFVPDRPFPAATRFECVVPAGTRAVNGKSVDKDYRWWFETPRPSVARHLPDDDDIKRAGTDVRFFLEFNQPMEPAVVRRAAVLIDVASGERRGVEARRPLAGEKEVLANWPEAPVERRVVIQPEGPLRLDADWRLELAAGLKGMEGPLPTLEPWVREFRTRGPFRLIGSPAGRASTRGITLQFSNPVDADSLGAHARIDPPAPRRLVWRDWEGNFVTLGGEFRPGQPYRIDLTPGLRDEFGQSLEPSPTVTVTIPDARPSVSIVPGDGVLERTGRRQVAILLTNVDRAELTMAAMTPVEIPAWIRSGKEYGRPGPASPARAGWRTLTRRTPWNVTDTLLVSTDDLLGPDGGGGIGLWVRSLDPAPAPPPGVPAPSIPADRAILRVTNIGLTGKSSATSHLFQAATLDRAGPIAGARLEVRNALGGLLWQGVTDGEGMARGDGLARPVGLEWPLFVTATAGHDMTWLVLGNDWALEPWNFGIASSEGWGVIDGFLHGDRDLYRPGETVHLRGILRRRSVEGLDPPADLPVRWEIDDPRGKELLRRTVALGAFGTTTIDLPLAAGARTGGYSVRIVPVAPEEGRHWGVWGNFQVAEYRAPEFEVVVRSARSNYQSGDALDAEISGRYFFGAPLVDGRVRWSLSRHPFLFAPPGYDDYSFSDPEATPDYELLAGRGEARLDRAGRVSVTAPLELGEVPVSLEYTLEADVRDQTGRGSAGRTTSVVHRGQVYPGVRVTPQLVRSGREITVQAVLLTPEKTPASGARGSLRVSRREWRTVRRQLVGGVIGAETVTVDSLLLARDLPAGPGPHAVRWTVPGAGYYRVQVEGIDRSGRKQTGVADFYASGPGEFSWGWTPGIALELVTDRKSYAPGDTARILVRSPFREARALFTLEREGIVTSWTRRLTGTSELVEVPIPARGSAPNLYFSALLLIGSEQRRGADARVRKPEFRLGYATLPVDHRGHRLDVTVRPDRIELAPRDSLTLQVELRDAAGRPRAGEVSVAVVDEAVLKLLGSGTPDPLSYFYRLQPLAVTTSELRRDVRQALSEKEKKGEDPGGGGGSEGESWRSAFATTAFWRGSLVTDGAGRATAGLRLPDNLTTFRVMVVAVDRKEAFGSADTTVTVTKPLLVQPALPRFLRVGDRFDAGAIVHNRSSRPLLLQVEAGAPGLTARGGAGPRSVNLAAGESRRVDFGFDVPAAGATKVRLSARGGGVIDGLEWTIPIEDPVIDRVDAAAGVVEGARLEEAIRLPVHSLPDSASVTLRLAPTIMVGAESAFDFLARYQYACAEQTTSSLWSRLLAARLFGWEPPGRVAAEAVERLSRFQCDDGGLSLWPGDRSSSPMITAWALLALAEARRAGGVVDPIVEPALRQLGWQLQAARGDTLARLERGSEWALVLWAMSVHPRPRDVEASFRSSLEFLTASRDRLSLMGRVYLVHAWAGQPGGETLQAALLRDLENRVDMVADMAWLARPDVERRWDLWWGSDVRTNGFYLAALASSGTRSTLEPRVARWLIDQVRIRRPLTTQGGLAALLGLAGYSGRYESGPVDLTVVSSFLKVPSEPVRFRSRDDRPAERSWPAPPPGGEGRLEIGRSGPGPLYYSALLRYREPSIGRPPEESAIALTRSWEPFDAGAARRGPAGSTLFHSGDLVLVRLTLVLPEAVDFLVVADPLPAGLEPVQLGFATTSQEAARRMSDRPALPPGYATLDEDYQEVRDREVRAYVDHVEPGVYEYRYLARAVTPGRYGVPRARAELMYRPEVVAFSDGPFVEVRQP